MSLNPHLRLRWRKQSGNLGDKTLTVRYFPYVVGRDSGSTRVGSNNIFDELDAVLTGGNGPAAQEYQRRAQCEDQASLVAPALQSADWADVMRRMEALNRFYSVNNDAHVENGISS